MTSSVEGGCALQRRGLQPSHLWHDAVMDPQSGSPRKRTPVLVPLAAATSNALPSVCVLTGQPTTGRWKRKLGKRSTISIPVNDELLATYEKRSRAARNFLVAACLSWALATAFAVPAANAPTTGPFGVIAGSLFVVGLPLFAVAIVLLAKRTGTVPIRWRVVVGDDRAWYLRIGNPSQAFAEAMQGASPVPAGPGAQLPSVAPPATRTHTPIRWKFLIPYAVYVLWFVIRRGDISTLVVVVTLLAAMGVVAASVKWRVHVGSVFAFTPVNAIVLLGIGALAGALGLISALDPQHGNSAGAEATSGIGFAVIAIILVIAVEMVWNSLRALLRRSRP